MIQFLVDVTLPSELTEEFLALIPRQRAEVGKLFAEGRLSSYGLALDRSKVWITLHAESENEVEHILESLPLRRAMNVQIHQLAILEHSHLNIALISMN